MVKHFPLSQPDFCIKFLLSVLPVLHKALPTSFQPLWHCNRNVDPEPLSLRPEKAHFLRAGVRAARAPAVPTASWRTSSRYWATEIPEERLLWRGTPSAHYLLIQEAARAGVHSQGVSHILPASPFLSQSGEGPSASCCKTNKTIWQGNQAMGTAGGTPHQLAIRNAARLCLLPDIVLLGRRCRRRPSEPGEWEKCKPLFGGNTEHFFKSQRLLFFLFPKFPLLWGLHFKGKVE